MGKIRFLIILTVPEEHVLEKLNGNPFATRDLARIRPTGYLLPPSSPGCEIRDVGESLKTRKIL